MGGGQKKSRKQLDGKPSARQRRRESCVFYLDENLSYCKAIRQVFDAEEIKYELHSSHFPDGAEDSIWLDFVGQRGWIVITKDKGHRYNLLERTQLQKHKIKQFAFPSGNMSGQEMADILRANLRKIFKFIEKENPPFVASLTKTGVYPRNFPPSN